MTRSVTVLAAIAAAIGIAALESGGATAGISAVVIEKKTSQESSDGKRDVQVRCDKAFVLVGGGAAVKGGGKEVALQESAAKESSEGTWKAAAAEIVPTGSEWKLKVQAICIDV